MKTTLYELAGTKFSENTIVKEVTEKLKEKYHQRFNVLKIGNRFGMGNYEEVTVFCCPIFERNMIFKAVFNMVDRSLVDDDFYIRDTCYELEEVLHKELKSYKINSTVKVEISGKSKLSKKSTVQQFLNEYKNSKFIATIVLAEDISKANLNVILSSLGRAFGQIQLKCLVYVMDKENYSKCSHEARTVPILTDAYIEKYQLNNTYMVELSNDEIIYL